MVKNIEPVVMKQTVSSDVSALIRSYMGSVVEKGGTGNAAKVDGYSMGGKTGTAQKGNREDKKYIVSFIGFAPLDDPQVVIYVVVDEPNAEYQADSKFAQFIAKGVLTEILPYLNIFPDQEMTGTVNNAMEELESYITQIAQENRQKSEETKEGTDDPNVPEPDEDDEELTLDNKQDSNGITNEEAGLESGN